jgi:hypothetical protein
MTKFGTLLLASAVAAASALPAVSQQAFERLAGESAIDMAKRIGACQGGSGVGSANFENNGALLRVTCAGGAFAPAAGAGGAVAPGVGAGAGLAGGLGAGAIAAGAVAVAGIAAAASGGGSSSTTTTN